MPQINIHTNKCKKSWEIPIFESRLLSQYGEPAMKNQFDYLVIGSGIAGLTFALKAARSGSVAIVTKKDKLETNTNYAQGGIASVFGQDDSFSLHVQDTLNAGDGLCHREVVDFVVNNGPERVRDLLELGVCFQSGVRPRLIRSGKRRGAQPQPDSSRPGHDRSGS